MVDALKRLEYRGYDSAGIATLEAGHLTRRRAEGKLRNLEIRLSKEPLSGTIGIGHTRWATHGRPNEINAHPHATDRVAVVHNGIIENFAELRAELEARGARFATETDTEVIPHLVTAEMNAGAGPTPPVAPPLPPPPRPLPRPLAHYINFAQGRIELPGKLPFDFRTIDRLSISACGTAYYAGLIGKYWFERFARLPVEIDVASEFRYREAPMAPGNLALFVSQSGETADTLATLRYAKEHKQHVVSIVNVATSTISRESDLVMPTLAGAEIGVASTKAFTCQLTVLACLAIAAGRARGVLSEEDEAKLVGALIETPRHMAAALALEPRIEQLARDLAKCRDVLYLGRGTSFPLALEAALKLNAVSYIHAEGYAAGELKHGPIALIDETMPVVVIAPYDRVFEKTVSNMQEVAARGGRIILITDPKGAREATVNSLVTMTVPEMPVTVTPLVYAIPVQLIAYHTAVIMGTDVDQPRNLAKSVTVE